jgi:hypothetical protein
MGNPGLEFSTAVNWSKITEALNYGKTHLDKVVSDSNQQKLLASHL